MATDLSGSHIWPQRLSDRRLTCMYAGGGGFGGARAFTLE
jgi:hypothetical protein